MVSAHLLPVVLYAQYTRSAEPRRVIRFQITPLPRCPRPSFASAAALMAPAPPWPSVQFPIWLAWPGPVSGWRGASCFFAGIEDRATLDIHQIAGIDVQARQAWVQDLAGANGHSLASDELDQPLPFQRHRGVHGVLARKGVVNDGAGQRAVGAAVKRDARGQFLRQVVAVVIEGVPGNRDAPAIGRPQVALVAAVDHVAGYRYAPRRHQVDVRFLAADEVPADGEEARVQVGFGRLMKRMFAPPGEKRDWMVLLAMVPSRMVAPSRRWSIGSPRLRARLPKHAGRSCIRCRCP